MTERTISHPRINIEHPRTPEPSRAQLWATADWLKNAVVRCPMSEEGLYDLVEEALKVAAVLRRQRIEGR